MNFVQLDQRFAKEIFSLEKKCFIEEAWTQSMIEESFKAQNTFFFGAIDCCDNSKEAECQKPQLIGYAVVLNYIDSCDLARICVEPFSKRRGIGKALLEYSIMQSKKLGAKKMMLEVNQDNFAAVSMYTNCDFKILSRRKYYYGNNSVATDKSGDALIMGKEL